jgi:serpin B
MSYASRAIALCMILSITLFHSLVVAAEKTDQEILVRDNSTFAIDLYRELRASEGNIFFSPYSVSTALAMTYAGARGNTEKEMAQTLRFSLGRENLHAAFEGIASRLNSLQKEENLTLRVANSLWPQRDYAFRDEYVSLIKKYYGVSITPVDYKRARETARKMINRWVQQRTQDKIKDLIRPGILTALTRLVLVNAVYFKGDWEYPFNTERTKDVPFYLSLHNTVQVPMMKQKQEFKYAEMETLQVLELPYAKGGLSMMVLLPRESDGLKRLEKDLTAERIIQWKRRMTMREVLVFLPKFRMTSMFRLDKRLMNMGMVDAFCDSKANFAGMDSRSNWLYIGAVLHKAFVDVNEEGTEAAAATAVVMVAKAIPTPPPVFRADHPFLFLIQDNKTGSILFVGRVVDPTDTGA